MKNRTRNYMVFPIYQIVIMILIGTIVNLSCTKDSDTIKPTIELSWDSYDPFTNKVSFDVNVIDNAAIKSVTVYQDNVSIFDSIASSRSELKSNWQFQANCQFNVNGIVLRAVVTDFAGNSEEEPISFYPEITIQSPTSTTNWQTNTAQTITWYCNIIGDDKIDLYKAGVFVRTISSSAPNNNETYSWRIPNDLVYGSDYKIKITSTSNAEIFAYSSSFTITKSATVTDIDGNIYNTIQIGNQIWTRENLRTTRYNDGSSIYSTSDILVWRVLTGGAFLYETVDEEHLKSYGRLYNWYSINTGKLAPKGWHVPTLDEWSDLISYLGGENIAGGKLKEEGTEHWDYPNTDATNDSGFTATNSGYQGFGGGLWIYTWDNAHFWTKSEFSIYAWGIRLNNRSAVANPTYTNKQYGFAVRLIKD